MNPPDEVHKSYGPNATKHYPDVKTVTDAIHEFRARVKAIADELGIHTMFVAAEFSLRDDKPAQCVIAYGCLPCSGVAAARGVSTLMEQTPEFSAGYVAATMAEAKEMVNCMAAMHKAQKEGYQA